MAMQGPLAPWAPGMAETLTALGYRPRLVERHLQLTGRLSKFLLRRGLAAADVSPEVVEQFVAALRAENGSCRPTSRSLSWLVDYLRRIGVATTPDAPRERTGEQELIERYREYLRVERGLEPVTIANYVRVVTRFLSAQRRRGLDELGAADVSEFMTSQCRQVSTGKPNASRPGCGRFWGTPWSTG